MELSRGLHPGVEHDVRLARMSEADEVAALVCAAYGEFVARTGITPAPMRANYHALIAQRLTFVHPGRTRIDGVLVLRPQLDHLLLEMLQCIRTFRVWG